jgi:hypothetical protein
MTEADALETAQEDAEILKSKIVNGAVPDDITKMLTGLMLRRINQMESRRATKAASTAAARRTTAPTFSEYLTARSMRILKAIKVHLPPEDTRALLIWFIGSPPQVPGILQHIISLLGESSGKQAVETAQQQTQQMLDQMQRSDHHLFNQQIQALCQTKRNLIRGKLLEAQWAFQERDGETAKCNVMQARKMALRWLKELEERTR